MNKYLMLSAAAVLASVSGTNAANKASATIYIGGVSAIQLGYSGVVYNARFLSCPDGAAIGQGLAAKTKVLGKNVDLSDNCFSEMGLFSSAMSFDLQLPLRNGHAWTTWLELFGTTSFAANSGTYKLHPGPRAVGNIMAQTKALIETLKKNRE
jgi:hypothetical protein